MAVPLGPPTAARVGARRYMVAAAVVGAALLTLAACRGGPSASALSPRYCGAVKAMANYDDGLRGDDDPGRIKQAYVRAVADLGPRLDTVAAEGPERAKKAVPPLRQALEKSRDEGVDSFDQQSEAGTEIVASSARGCRWQERSLTALDYRFAGAPERWKGGTIALTLENRSKNEPHLFLLARVKEGVATPMDELVSQFQGPDTAPDADIEFVNGGTFAPPGASTTGLVELRPGRYIYLCPLPVEGATSEADDHASRGMKGELTVP